MLMEIVKKATAKAEDWPPRAQCFFQDPDYLLLLTCNCNAIHWNTFLIGFNVRDLNPDHFDLFSNSPLFDPSPIIPSVTNRQVGRQ